MTTNQKIIVRKPQENQLIRYLNPKHIITTLWQYRELMQQFSMRFLTESYQGAVLGLSWVIIEPLITLLIYTFVFGVIFKSRWTGDTDLNFALIMFAGLIAHNLFAQILVNSASILKNNISYIKKVLFPLEILIFSTVGASIVRSFISVAILLIFLLVSGHIPPITFVLLPIIMIPLVILATGLGLMLASVGIVIEDLKHVITVAVQLLFFMTPIVYDVAVVPERLRWVAYINPMTWIVQGYRDVLLFNKGIDLTAYVLLLLGSVILCLLGYAWFNQLRPIFSDYV